MGANYNNLFKMGLIYAKSKKANILLMVEDSYFLRNKIQSHKEFIDIGLERVIIKNITFENMTTGKENFCYIKHKNK